MSYDHDDAGFADGYADGFDEAIDLAFYFLSEGQRKGYSLAKVEEMLSESVDNGGNRLSGKSAVDREWEAAKRDGLIK